MKQFTLEDTNPMSWEEFGTTVSQLVGQIEEYCHTHQVTINAVAPILRNGAIPGTIISNKLQIITQLPIQVKYDYHQQEPQQLLPFIKPLTVELGSSPIILVTECNTFSGESAKMAANILLESYPGARLLYATVTRVYRYPEVTLPIFVKYFYGVMTNENFEANQETVQALGLRHGITVFPWESHEQELADVNAALSD